MKLQDIIDKLESIKNLAGPTAEVWFCMQNTDGSTVYYDVEPRVVSDPNSHDKTVLL